MVLLALQSLNPQSLWQTFLPVLVELCFLIHDHVVQAPVNTLKPLDLTLLLIYQYLFSVQFCLIKLLTNKSIFLSQHRIPTPLLSLELFLGLSRTHIVLKWSSNICIRSMELLFSRIYFVF